DDKPRLSPGFVRQPLLQGKRRRVTQVTLSLGSIDPLSALRRGVVPGPLLVVEARSGSRAEHGETAAVTAFPTAATPPGCPPAPGVGAAREGAAKPAQLAVAAATALGSTGRR